MNDNLIRRLLRRVRWYGAATPGPDESEKLVRFAATHFANDFPNPDRIDCISQQSVTDTISRHELPSAGLRAHLLTCSECFRYYQTELEAQRALALPVPQLEGAPWAISTRILVPSLVGALAFVLAITVVLVGLFQRPSQPGNHFEGKLPGSTPATPSGDSQPGPSPSKEHTGSQSQPGPATEDKGSAGENASEALVAVNRVGLDLRTYDALRGAGGSQSARLVLHKTSNELTVQLPAGSPRGSYKSRLTDPYGNSVQETNSISQDGNNLKIAFNLASVKPGNYLFCLSRQEEVPNCVPVIVESPRRRLKR